MFELFVKDSVFFIIGLVAAVIFLYGRTKKHPVLRPFGLFYIGGTLSSYNIMIKPIHDFNLLVPRTFLTHGKIVGPLSALDAVMVVSIGYIILSWIFSKRRSIRLPAEFQIILAKDIVLAITSLVLFLYLTVETQSPLGGELAWYRQTVYFIVLFYFAGRIIRRYPDINMMEVFTTFMIIDACNFASGFASTLVYGDYAWQRYFLNVSIIDQDDILIAVMYPLLLVYMWVKRSAFSMSRGVIWTSALITVLLLANLYKGSVAYIFLFLPFLVICALIQRQKSFRPMLASLIIFPAGILFYWIFFVLYAPAALETRANAFEDLLDYSSNLGVIYPYTGIGNGTLFDRRDNDEDQGEVKVIDKEAAANKAMVMQSPGAQIYKAAGFPGVFLHIVAAVSACFLVIRRRIVNHPISAAAGYLICMYFILNFTFLDPTGVAPFLVVKLSLLSLLALKAVKRHGVP